MTGNAQVDELRLRGPRSMTSTSALLGMVRTEPRIATDVAVFLAVTLVARVRARRRVSGGDFTTWLRDESSRARPRA